MNENSSVLYYRHGKIVGLLSDREVGQLVRTIFAYIQRAETPDFDGILMMAFIAIKGDLDRDRLEHEGTGD